jgi:hypothetical protein
MRACARSALVCTPPFGVAFNSVGKRRLIWDGFDVNKNLRKHKFKMETLQREGSSLLAQPVRRHCGYFQCVPSHRDGRICTPFPRFRVARSILLLLSAPLRPLVGPVVIHRHHKPLHPLHPLNGWQCHSHPRRLYFRRIHGPRDRDVGPANAGRPARVRVADTPDQMCRHKFSRPDVRRLGHARRLCGTHLRGAARDPDFDPVHKEMLNAFSEIFARCTKFHNKARLEPSRRHQRWRSSPGRPRECSA